MDKKTGLVSPAQMGDKGTKGGDVAKPSGSLVSPAKNTNKSESQGHKNG